MRVGYEPPRPLRGPPDAGTGYRRTPVDRAEAVARIWTVLAGGSPGDDAYEARRSADLPVPRTSLELPDAGRPFFPSRGEDRGKDIVPERIRRAHQTRRPGLEPDSARLAAAGAFAVIKTEHPSDLEGHVQKHRQFGAIIEGETGEAGGATFRPWAVPPAPSAGAKDRATPQGGGRPRGEAIIEAARTPLYGPEQEVAEFIDDLREGRATSIMVDFEGKVRDPAVIRLYVDEIEKAGFRPGVDVHVLVRLPGAKEVDADDRARRAGIFDLVAELNRARVEAGEPLTIDRLIIADAQSVEELQEVHRSYDAAVARAYGSSPPPTEALRIQALPLVEGPVAVLRGADLMRAYVDFYRDTYGQLPGVLLLFISGSDLNREVGPIAGHLLRKILLSRMAKLQDELEDETMILPWLGGGSGMMRSGAGREPGLFSLLHPGCLSTLQPDHLDQPHLQETLDHMALARALPPEKLTDGQGQALLQLAVPFIESHVRLSTRFAIASARFDRLFGAYNLRARKSTNAGSEGIFELADDGRLHLRSVRPASGVEAGGYGRVIDLRGLAQELEGPADQHDGAKRILALQGEVEALWPPGIKDGRAIRGNMARFLGAQSLTTLHGLGLALKDAEENGLIPDFFQEELVAITSAFVRDEGFVLTDQRPLVEKRVRVMNPELEGERLAGAVDEYFHDIAATRAWLALQGVPMDDLVRTDERLDYETESRRLFRAPWFQFYMSGENIPDRLWMRVMDDSLTAMHHPGWNRGG